jgi:hypothetical protein
MAKLNFWDTTWSLDPATCPCDVDFLDYLAAQGVRGKTIFHFGTGNHHVVGMRTAADGRDNAVLGITASPQEYAAYIDLLINNPQIGRTYKAYFGDIYLIDGRLLPGFDYVTLFHLGEYRTAENDAYGALSDLGMAEVLAGKVRSGGEMLFFRGSFAYDKAQAAARQLIDAHGFAEAGTFKSLRIIKKRVL